jgi:hypothetical protein
MAEDDSIFESTLTQQSSPPFQSPGKAEKSRMENRALDFVFLKNK